MKSPLKIVFVPNSRCRRKSGSNIEECKTTTDADVDGNEEKGEMSRMQNHENLDKFSSCKNSRMNLLIIA